MSSTASRTSDYDVLIVGGGPSGATAAIVLARAGFRVLVIERSAFPRFHVGESFLPRNLTLLRDLELESALSKLTRVPKYGAEFGFGNGRATAKISFDMGLVGGEVETFNIERAPFDAMLLDTARDAGAEVTENAAVRRILSLADGHVEIEVDGRRVSGRHLIDASGQATLVGKHLEMRRGFAHHRKVSYFGHYENVQRLCGKEAGYPTLVMCDEGWFWLIPIDEKRTSIGLVLDADVARQVDVPAPHMLAWGVERCPLVRERAVDAVAPDTNHVIADFSYTCHPYAGPGFFMVGDSAVFYDPIFSSGICLAMMAAAEAAGAIKEMLRGITAPAKARKRYAKLIKNSSSAYFRLVNHYYDHSFREMLLSGPAPLGLDRAVISVLAGHVFPKPAFSLRWRLRLLDLMVKANRRLPLVARHERFSLLSPGRDPVRSAPSAAGM